MGKRQLIFLLFILSVGIESVDAQGRILKFTPNPNLPEFERIFNPGHFVIKGKMEHYGQDFLEFRISSLHDVFAEETLVVPLGEDGTFEASFPIIGGQRLSIDYHGHDQSFQIRGKDTLEFYSAKDDFRRLHTIQQNAQHLRDIEQQKNQFQQKHWSSFQQKIGAESNEDNIRAIAQDYLDSLAEFIKSLYDHGSGISPAYLRIEQLIEDTYFQVSAIVWSKTGKLVELAMPAPMITPNIPQIEGRRVQASVNSSATTYNESKYMDSPDYRQYVEYLLDYDPLDRTPTLRFRAGPTGPLLQKVYRVLGTFGYSALISENMLLNAIVNRAKHYEKTDVEQAFAFAKTHIRSEYLKNKLVEFEHVYKTLAAGNPAPDFEFEDRDGKLVRLSDLKGKVIYLDFWGVYCGACITENKNYAPEIYNYYADDDVVFVNVCMDVDREKWRQSIPEKRSNVLELYAEGESKNQFVRAYNVRGIPHYFLIDKEGKIQNHHASRPSSLSRDLENNELSKLLKN